MDLSNNLVALLIFCDLNDTDQIIGLNHLSLISQPAIPPTTVCHTISNLRLIIIVEEVTKADNLIRLAESNFLEVFPTIQDIQLDVLATMINSLFIYSNKGTNFLDITDPYVFRTIWDIFDMFCEYMDSLEYDEFEYYKLKWAEVRL
jgi:hypothetical protein